MNQEFKINNFDILRVFAATQVVLIHSFPHLNLPFPAWFNALRYFPGVPMFFVMSGYLISASLERNGDLKNYFRNRALRIYPALWFCIIISIITIYFVAKINFFTWQGLGWFITQCLGFIYTPAFLESWGFGSYNGSLWTIPIELQFYIVLPIVYYVISLFTKQEIHKTIAISIIFLILTFAAYYILEHFSNSNLMLETKLQKIIRYTFIPHIYLFFSGVLLQRINAYKLKIIQGKALIWVTAYLLFYYLAPDNNVTMIIGNLFLGICTISLAYTFSGAATKLLNHNDISYGVYIYHGLILGALVEVNFLGSNYYVVFILIVTYLIAFISWRFIEKPSIQRKKKALRAID